MRFLSIPVLSLCFMLAATGPARRDQPGPDATKFLSFVDPPVSISGSDDNKCSSAITADDAYLAFPNARIIHQSSGAIDCQTTLRLAASQTGYRFSVSSVSLGGYLYLEPGAYVERVNVSLGYFPDGKQTDVATVRNVYGKSGVSYDGVFNLTVPVAAGGSGGGLGSTACRTSTADPRTGIYVYVFVSLAHEMIEFDDNSPHYGTVGGNSSDGELRVDFEGGWEKC